MSIINNLLRAGAAGGTLVLGASLAACAAPAASASACPASFVDQANAASTSSDLGVTFTEGAVGDVEPTELQALVPNACVLAFSGDISGGHAEGHFVFTTTAIDETAFATAVEGLGYTGESGTWTKSTTGSTSNEGDIITETSVTDSGSLLNIAEIFPAATNIISSFHISVGS